MDNFLKGLSPFDPNGNLSNPDADRIWNSYKAAGGGRDVSASISGAGGFGALGGNGGLLDMLQRRFGGGAPAPAVPADGSMQPTIGPGAAPPAAAPQAPVKMGLPPGGIIGLLQGQSPQGLIGMLQRAMPQGAGAPLAGGMPQAGMLPGMPGAPPATPPAAPPQLPMDINPMNQF